ncbi:unnamed protein product [Chrysoparadoxa australica]
MDAIASLFHNFLEASHASFFCLEVVGALNHLINHHGDHLTEGQISYILPHLLLLGQRPSNTHGVQYAAVEGLATMTGQKCWARMGKTGQAAAAQCLLQSLLVSWKGALATQVDARITATAARGLACIAMGSRDYIATQVPRCAVALSNLLQLPVPSRAVQLEGEVQVQGQVKLKDSGAMTGMIPREGNRVDCSGEQCPSEKETMEVRLQAANLLTALATHNSKALHPLWPLFLPVSSAAGPSSMELRGHTTGPVQPAGLILVMRRDPSPQVRKAATQAAAGLIKGAPIKLWLGVRGGDNGHSGGLSGKTRGTLLHLHEELAKGLQEEEVPAVLSQLCQCITIAAAESSCVYTPLGLKVDRLDCFNCAGCRSDTSHSQAQAQGQAVPGRGGAHSSSFDQLLLRIVAGLLLLLLDDSAEAASRVAASQALTAVLSQKTPLAAPAHFLGCQYSGPNTHEALKPVEHFIALASRTDALRAEALVLMTRVVRMYLIEAMPLETWTRAVRVLVGCFSNADQNIRLHSLKVVEEAITARGKLLLAHEGATGQEGTQPIAALLTDASWGELVHTHLPRRFTDSYHGVRAVACACYGQLLSCDWRAFSQAEVSQCIKRLLGAAHDSSSGVQATSCRVIGLIATLPRNEIPWAYSNPFVGDAIRVLLELGCSTAYITVRLQAMTAMGNILSGGALKLMEWDVTEQLCSVSLEGLEGGERLAGSAFRVLGLATANIEATEERQAALQQKVLMEIAQEMQGSSSGSGRGSGSGSSGNLSDKSMWNACNALGTCLSQPHLQVAMPHAPWSSPVLSALVAALASRSVKVRTHAAVALRLLPMASHPYPYGDQLAEVIRAALEGLRVARAEQAGKQEAALQEALRGLAMHVLLPLLLLEGEEATNCISVLGVNAELVVSLWGSPEAVEEAGLLASQLRRNDADAHTSQRMLSEALQQLEKLLSRGESMAPLRMLQLLRADIYRASGEETNTENEL